MFSGDRNTPYTMLKPLVCFSGLYVVFLSGVWVPLAMLASVTGHRRLGARC